MNVDDGFWTRIVSSVRPSATELQPDISRYAHNGLIDFHPKSVAPNTQAAFRTCAKDSATDDVLFKLQDKPLRNLTRLGMPAFEMIQLPDLSLQFGGLSKDITAELE